ncbi:hypothetical protein TSUD_172000 [Trifolium subterraneum]|uniref:Uncharacterized protein n=1 Tax=Trifolium subterraneum TaxID=3900 RepID=A0A2Z6LZH8_TRISU|nr:hypothetical protein TSUD_172000 [Trifolium subterraneum]
MMLQIWFRAATVTSLSAVIVGVFDLVLRRCSSVSFVSSSGLRFPASLVMVSWM